MTQDEYRTQFALWCMWSSPLSLTFDPRKNTVTDDDISILTNREMIAINQDRMGQQADLISEKDSLVVFAKDCENGDVVVSVTNMSASTKEAAINLADIPALSSDKVYACRDVWDHKNLNDVQSSITTEVRSHATRVFRLSKKE